MFATNCFHGRMLLAHYVENVDGVRILFKATVLYARHLHFSLRIHIVENTLTSSFTIHIMKVFRQSPIHVHDVAGKFAIYYPHHEGA